jgi:hypothetical protein
LTSGVKNRALFEGPSPFHHPLDYWFLKLEDLRADSTVRGVVRDAAVSVVSVKSMGPDARLVYRARTAASLAYRHAEPRLEVVEGGEPRVEQPAPLNGDEESR